MALSLNEIIARVSGEVRAAEDIDDALLAAVRITCASCQIPYGEVWKSYGGRQSLYLKSAWHFPDMDFSEFVTGSRKYAFAVGVGTPGRVWRSRQPETIEDLMVCPSDFARQSIALSAGFRSVVGCPVLCRDDLVAIFVFLMFRSRRELLPTLESVAKTVGATLSEHWPDSRIDPHARHAGLLVAA